MCIYIYIYTFNTHTDIHTYMYIYLCMYEMQIYILTYDRGYLTFTDMIFPAWTAFLAGCRSCRWCVVHLAAGAIGLLLRPWNMTSGNVNVPGTLGIWSWDRWGDCCDDHRWCDDVFGKWMNTARSRSRWLGRFNVMGSCRLSGSCDSCGEARVELLRAVCLACALVMAEDAKGSAYPVVKKRTSWYVEVKLCWNHSGLLPWFPF